MKTSIRLTALAAAIAAALPALAQTASTLPPVIVTATGIPYNDAEATYASEVHNREAIEVSGASTLYDYLAQHSSLNVMPSYGNKATPLIDMRGYGGNGYQNISFTVDGQRLNNIDMLGPLIGAIPLDSIESIEISKGSGSVMYGDGAMAGAVQIHTRAKTGASASVTVGSYGTQSTNVSAGMSKELIDLAFSSNNDAFGGTSEADASGHRNHSATRTEQGRVTLKPNADFKVFAEATNSHIDLRYANAMTLAQFDADPAQHVGGNYTHQIFDSRSLRLGGELKLSKEATLAYTHNGEDKNSTYAGFAPYSYDIRGDELRLRYNGRLFDLTTGLQTFDGNRISSSDQTSKKNSAVFAQGMYRLGQLSVSAGVRAEHVEYVYAPTVGTQLKGNHDLHAWDVGTNYRINEQTSVFANFNSAFQAPDIDRFFDFYTGSFNAFIQPAKSRTLTLGINHDTSHNRLRVAGFYSRLNNEIYLEPVTYLNTNIDKSHKYGLEVQDTWQATNTLSLNAGYTYTRALIDNTTQGAGAYDGKELPGVPRHGVTVGATWQPWADAKLNASHVWRSWAYSANDFTNSLSQHQAAYQSTNLSFRQRWGKVEGSIGIDNLFAHKNGIWIRDNSIYPIDFERIIKVGVKVEL